MTLAKVVAPIGEGKTLFMTYVGFLDYAAGRRVITNYNLNFPKGYAGTVEMLDPDDLYDITNTELVDCTILLDELWVFMDSWLSGSKQNRLLSYLMLQSRKRNVDIYGSAQSSMQFANRFRDNIDFAIYPKMYGDYLTWKLFDGHTHELIDKYSVNGAYLYDLYDTRQIINPEAYQMKQEDKKNGKRKPSKVQNQKGKAGNVQGQAETEYPKRVGKANHRPSKGQTDSTDAKRSSAAKDRQKQNRSGTESPKAWIQP